MWLVRILSGQQAGQVFPLKPGTNVIGRSPSCHVRLATPSVSKEHAQIEVYPDKVVVADLGSRNGTFVNGVKIRSAKVGPGDKISLHDTILEVLPMTVLHPQRPAQGQFYGNVAYQQYPQHHQQPQNAQASQSQPQTQGSASATPQNLHSLLGHIQAYVDNVVLPGVYRLPQMFEFKWVVALLITVYVVAVTALSSVPLMRILKVSVEQESQRRALTIARTLSRINRPALMQGLDSALSTELAQREPGVDQAFIISNIDGSIMAPAAQAGKYPDTPFVHSARRLGKEVVEQIDSSTIGALVPIEFFNSNTGSQSIHAHAVVIYNMGSLAIDNGRTLSLLIQTFFISLVVGAVLFFFVFKLFEYPISNVNRQLDMALRDRRDDIKLDFQFAPLQKLISNINSTLNRLISGAGFGENAGVRVQHDRNAEMQNMVQLVGFAAVAINAETHTIAATNTSFDEKTSQNSIDLIQQPIDKITDQALVLSIKDLIDRATQQPDQLISNQLEFGGQAYELVAQAVYGDQSISYFIVVLLPAQEGAGE